MKIIERGRRAVALVLAVTIVVTPLGAYAQTATETITHYHNDIAGSPLAASDNAGNLVWQESYRPYGERIENAAASSTNKLWFHGKQVDDDSGLSYFGARSYDPVVGRFMGVDPRRFDEDDLHSFSRYTYGSNNPYKYRDPNGQGAELIIALFAVAGILAIASGYKPTTPGYGRSDLGESLVFNENSRERGSSSNNGLSGNSVSGGAMPPDDEGKGPRTPTDRYKGALDQRTLDAARREMNDEVVARKPDGTPYDHLTKVRNAMNGLRNRIEEINGKLGSPSARLTDAERSALTRELSEASRLLDRANSYLQ